MQAQNSTDLQTWTKFFRSAHIPQQYATVYANKFIENRIRFDMLGDMSRELLQELGINAIGDCLSILKHAKTINNALEETAKKEHISSVQTYDDSPQSSALKRRCELAKRLIGSYTSSESSSETTITTTKPTLTADVVVAPKPPTSVVVNSSKLSADLQSRLNFGGGSNNGHHQPVVKFNEGSLSSTKVIVSSTTLDDDDDTKRTFSSKRKLIGRDEIDDDEEDQSEFIGSIKKRVSTSSIPNTAKIAPTLKSRLSLNTNVKTPESKVVTLKKSSLTTEKIPSQSDTLYSSRIEAEKSSVFDRINSKKSTEIKRPGLVDKSAIVRSLTTTSRVNDSDVKSRISRDVPVKVTFSGRLGNVAVSKPSIKDRLSFTK